MNRLTLLVIQFRNKENISAKSRKTVVAAFCNLTLMQTLQSPIAAPKKFLRDIAFDLPGRFPIARWAPIPLRLIVGFGFMEHGFAKLSKGPDTFAAILHALAVPAPHFTAWASILTELLGGLAILLGAFVSLVS